MAPALGAQEAGEELQRDHQSRVMHMRKKDTGHGPLCLVGEETPEGVSLCVSS